MRRPFLYLLLAVGCCACGEDPTLPLIGDWQAVSVTENGDSLRLDPTEVGFTFRPDQRYHFRSTLKYTEAGTWSYDRGFLIAQDTTQPNTPERVVEVEKLTPDTLLLRMMEGTAERHLLLLKN